MSRQRLIYEMCSIPTDIEYLAEEFGISTTKVARDIYSMRQNGCDIENIGSRTFPEYQSFGEHPPCSVTGKMLKLMGDGKWYTNKWIYEHIKKAQVKNILCGYEYEVRKVSGFIWEYRLVLDKFGRVIKTNKGNQKETTA